MRGPVDPEDWRRQGEGAVKDILTDVAVTRAGMIVATYQRPKPAPDKLESWSIAVKYEAVPECISIRIETPFDQKRLDALFARMRNGQEAGGL